MLLVLPKDPLVDVEDVDAEDVAELPKLRLLPPLLNNKNLKMLM